MIVIIGSEEETHAKYIADKLNKNGIENIFFDSREYPENLSISYSLGDSSFDSFLTIKNKKIKLSEIKGVYWRWFYGVKQQFFENTDSKVTNIVHRECKSALESLFYISQNTNCNWLNSIEAINLHKTKAYQLDILSKNNIRIPKTLITNNTEAVSEFYFSNDKKVIYKPVLGGAYTKQLTEEDFNEEKKEALKYSPIQLQEYIEGVDIRVYVVGEKIFAGKIEAQTIDFREDSDAQITPVELPQNIQADCLKTIKALKLRYSGVDIRLTPEGEYVFIEANPAPMFIHFERVTGYPISDTLMQELIK